MKRVGLLATVVMILLMLSACGCSHQWEDATCISPRTCTVCGETEGEALGHDFSPASCVAPKTCTVCGETEGEALGHNFSPASCVKPKTCTICGETEGKALGHDFTFVSCTTPRTCAVCGETEKEAPGHNFSPASCTEPKTCTVCGETEGEALGHAFSPASCTVPQTCTVCGETRGEKLAHHFAAATCDSPATCTVCGFTQGEPLGHNWEIVTTAYLPEQLTCTRCGMSYLDYEFQKDMMERTLPTTRNDIPEWTLPTIRNDVPEWTVPSPESILGKLETGASQKNSPAEESDSDSEIIMAVSLMFLGLICICTLCGKAVEKLKPISPFSVPKHVKTVSPPPEPRQETPTFVCDVCGADLFPENMYILNNALLCRSCFLKECEKTSHAQH